MLTCTVCGETFDSDYKLMKHMSKNHPMAERKGWVGGEDDHSCSCGGHMHHGEQ